MLSEMQLHEVLNYAVQLVQKGTIKVMGSMNTGATEL